MYRELCKTSNYSSFQLPITFNPFLQSFSSIPHHCINIFSYNSFFRFQLDSNVMSVEFRFRIKIGIHVVNQSKEITLSVTSWIATRIRLLMSDFHSKKVCGINLMIGESWAKVRQEEKMNCFYFSGIWTNVLCPDYKFLLIPIPSLLSLYFLPLYFLLVSHNVSVNMTRNKITSFFFYSLLTYLLLLPLFLSLYWFFMLTWSVLEKYNTQHSIYKLQDVRHIYTKSLLF